MSAGSRAYTRAEAKLEGGLVEDDLGGCPILVLAGPAPEQVTMSAFCRLLGDRLLSFELDQGEIRDLDTGSCWSIEGRATSGPLAGEGLQLQPLRWQYVRWHAWVYPHPQTELFLSSEPQPHYPNFPAYPQVEVFAAVLKRLATLESKLTFSHVALELALPHEAHEGICVFQREDRLNLYRFASAAAAHDPVVLPGAGLGGRPRGGGPQDGRVSASSCVCSRMVEPWGAAMWGSALGVWNPPAACQVEPEVSSERSISTTSLQPYLVRW